MCSDPIFSSNKVSWSLFNSTSYILDIILQPPKDLLPTRPGLEGSGKFFKKKETIIFMKVTGGKSYFS